MSGQKIAGGMTYNTHEGVDYVNIIHFFEEGNSREIFEKKKVYYLASANKTKARLILARTRINDIKLNEDVANNLNQKISKAIEWTRNLKENLKNSDNEKEFQQVISYKKWHEVKLIPQASEGCALSCFLKDKLNKRTSDRINKFNDADIHNKKAERLLINVLDFNKDINFKLKEEQLSNAYKELDMAFKALDYF